MQVVLQNNIIDTVLLSTKLKKIYIYISHPNLNFLSRPLFYILFVETHGHIHWPI